jgi:CheY-like chemotaxis protein
MVRRLLVVDDSEDIRDLMPMVFTASGWQVETAAHGLECMEVIRQGFEGVVLLDVMMPFMDGWETLRQMRDGGYLEHNRVVMLSALEPPPLGDLAPCVHGYFCKPFDISILKDCLEQALTLNPG